jgi:hypothetical protein
LTKTQFTVIIDSLTNTLEHTMKDHNVAAAITALTRAAQDRSDRVHGFEGTAYTLGFLESAVAMAVSELPADVRQAFIDNMLEQATLTTETTDDLLIERMAAEHELFHHQMSEHDAYMAAYRAEGAQ